MKLPNSLAVLAALSLGASALPAQTIYLLDFNDTADAGGYVGGVGAWNTYADPNNIMGGVIADTLGSTAAGITLSHLGATNSGNGNANTLNNPTGGASWVTMDGALANTAAAADYFWTGGFTADTNTFSLTLGSLVPGSTASLDLWFSRVADSTNGKFEYSLDGGGSWSGFTVLERDGTPSTADGWDLADTQTANFAGERDGNNASRYMNADAITIGGPGTVDIRVTNGTNWVGLAAIRLTITPTDADVMIATQPVSRTVTEFRPATFSVGATGSPPLAFQWYKVGAPDEPIDGATTSNFTIPDTSLAENGDQFYVVVSNGSSTETSDTVTLTVEADVVPPSPQFAGSPDGNNIVVTFSEPLDVTSATTPGSYGVTFEGGSASVTSAVLSADLLTATLTLDSQVSGQFNLSVAGVTDRAGNASDPNFILGQAPVEGTVSYLFDFGGNPTSKGAPPNDPFFDWNNVTNAIGANDFGILSDVITTEGTATSVALEMITRFNATNTNGDLESELFPASASGDSLYGNTEIFNNLENIFPSFKLTGLDQGFSHTLTLYAARLGVTDNRETQYTITGADGDVVVFFNPSQNDTDQTVVVPDILPTAAGEITIALAPGPGNMNANHFTYLSVLRIDSVPANLAPFIITYVDFERETNAVTLRFNGRPGQFYYLYGSINLIDWFEINDNVEGMGPDTEVQFIDLEADGQPMRYYRLEEIP